MRNPFLLAVIGALLLSSGWLGISGIPVLFGFIPLLVISGRYDRSRRSFWKMAAWTAICLGLWSGVTTWWIAYEGLPGLVMGAVLSVLITVVLFGSVFMLFHYVSKRAPAPLAYTLLVAGWIAAEYLYTVGQVSFPWLVLGNGFSNDIRLVQWYDTTGVFGGSLWVWLCNITVYLALVYRRPRVWLVPLAVLLLPAGTSLVKYFTYREQGDTVVATVVQPNFDPYEEKFTTPRATQHNILLSLAGQAPPEADFILLPETAVDRIWENELGTDPVVEGFRTVARRYRNGEIVLGASTLRRYGSGEKISDTAREHPSGFRYDAYNSALGIDSAGVNGIYHKGKLVVGVERIPYYDFLKRFEFLFVELGGMSGQLGTDPERAVFTSPRGYRIGPAICWEGVYGEFFGEFVRAGADVMGIISNDGWWGDTQGYRHLFSFSRLRAVEHRRAIARSANTGISGFIDQRGDVISRTGWDERLTLSAHIKTNDRLTFYTRYGDYVGRLCSLVFVLCFLYYVAYRFRRRNLAA